jgi:hypothetical protein
MKSKLLLSLIISSITGTAFADCDSVYQASIIATQKRLEEVTPSVVNKGVRMGLATTTGAASGAIAYAALGGPANVMGSIPAFGFFAPAGFMLGVAITRTDGDRQEELETWRLRLLSDAYKLLREAAIGGGYQIEAILYQVIDRTKRNDISPRLVANTIQSLNQQNRFCQDGQNLSTVDGIFNEVVAELSK